ncbi:MAG: DUF4229 domain-containing protein [Corynebacterium sp.]|nr:DUF4229 domain-containing protein [Corynebacterium sp.]
MKEVDPQVRAASRKAIVKYGAARVVLFIALTAIIQLIAVAMSTPVPLVFTALLALFVALPLSMLIFSSWRIEATEALAEYSRQRREHKEWVQRELAGRGEADAETAVRS